jgi:transcriptional regulator with XRE-family HTH domain
MTREEIGLIILAARKRQGLSQKELAKKCGISRYQQILEIEKAQFDYSISMLIKIVSGLGLELRLHDPVAIEEPKKLNGHTNGRVYDFSKPPNIKLKQRNYVKNSK